MTCQCEYIGHNRSCKGTATHTVQTIYGPFQICDDCERDHPIPAEFRR
jgi:hypothetical protein